MLLSYALEVSFHVVWFHDCQTASGAVGIATSEVSVNAHPYGRTPGLPGPSMFQQWAARQPRSAASPSRRTKTTVVNALVRWCCIMLLSIRDEGSNALHPLCLQSTPSGIPVSRLHYNISHQAHAAR